MCYGSVSKRNNFYKGIFQILFLTLCIIFIKSPYTYGTTIQESVNLQVTLFLEKVSGDNQNGCVGEALNDPFVVKVTDKNGNGIAGASITFSINSQPAGASGASLSTTNATTNSNGQAETILTVADKGGTYTVSATATDTEVSTGSPQVFTASGVEVVDITGLDTLYCNHADCSEVVTAVLTSGMALPNGCSITWGGDATFSNESNLNVTAHFTGHIGKNRRITAAIGTQNPAEESDPFTVVNYTAEPTAAAAVTYNYSWINPGANWGRTVSQDPVSDITAYFDHSTHTWRCRDTTATCAVQRGWHLLPGVQEASLAVATAANWRQIVADLSALGGNNWYVLAAVEAHEMVHCNLWETENNALFAVFRATVEALSVPYSDGITETPAQAKAAIKALAAYINAETKYINDGNTQWVNVVDHPASDAATDAAEHAVVDPIIQAITNAAVANGWP